MGVGRTVNLGTLISARSSSHKTQCIFTGDGAEMRDMVTANGIIEPLIRLVDMAAPVSPLHLYSLSL